MNPTLPKVLSKAVQLFLCMVFLHIQAFSQHLILGNEKIKIEAGLNFGPTFFLGDHGGNRGKGTTFIKDVNLELTKMMKGAFISFYPADWIGLRVAGQYTFVSGKDYIINTTGEDELYRRERNLDFKSHMWEAYAALELFPTMMMNKYDDYDPRLKPYGFIGIGLFHFNPQGSLTDAGGKTTWHYLKPLSTEGQGMPQYPNRKPYQLTQLNVPMGAGIKYDLSAKVNIGTELLYRKTFTDYIDDLSTTYIDPVNFDRNLSASDAVLARALYDKVKFVGTPVNNRTPPGEQRGNSKNNDAYFSFLLKLGIKLGPSYGSAEQRNAARQTRCPHFY
jgi:hypothetical protein